MDFTIRLLIGLGTALTVSGIGCGSVYLNKRKRKAHGTKWIEKGEADHERSKNIKKEYTNWRR